MFIGIPYVSCTTPFEFRAVTQTPCLQHS